MRRKRLICAILALVLLFSATPSAFAAYNTTITGYAMMATVDVDVPGGGGTLINPLQLPVWIGDTESVEQIISEPDYIANLSEVPVSVDVTVYGAVRAGSTMTLASSPTRGSGTQKAAFLYFEMIKSNSYDTDNASWASSYSSSKHIAIGNKQTVTKSGYVTLARGSNGTAAEGGYALFRVAGDAAKNPTVRWNSADGVNVQVAFTFTPLPYDS